MAPSLTFTQGHAWQIAITIPLLIPLPTVAEMYALEVQLSMRMYQR